MKKNKLVYGAILAAFMLNTVTMNSSYSTSSANSDEQYIFETAQRVGPEEMIRTGFKKGVLSRVDYNNPKSVYIVQQHILTQLYPNRPDLFRTAVCTLGKCLEEDGRYTKKQADKVVKFMLNFKSSVR